LEEEGEKVDIYRAYYSANGNPNQQQQQQQIQAKKQQQKPSPTNTKSNRHLVSLKRYIFVNSSVCLSFVTIAYLIFIPATDSGINKNSWSPVQSDLLLNYGRVLWALCWSVITFACYYGYIRWINSFLSHRIWTPLSRLTYGMYLVHPVWIKFMSGTEKQFLSFSYLGVALVLENVRT